MLNFRTPPRQNTSLKFQRGNIATVLFGAVAMVGIVSAVTMQLITGPIRTGKRG